MLLAPTPTLYNKLGTHTHTHSKTSWEIKREASGTRNFVLIVENLRSEEINPRNGMPNHIPYKNTGGKHRVAARRLLCIFTQKLKTREAKTGGRLEAKAK